MLNTNLKTLLEKEMTRKEFVLHLGVLILSLLGIYKFTSHALELFGHNNKKSGQSYGSMPYSGANKEV
jgi:hypothetical protein